VKILWNGTFCWSAKTFLISQVLARLLILTATVVLSLLVLKDTEDLRRGYEIREN
jgi:hypothetical protein